MKKNLLILLTICIVLINITYADTDIKELVKTADEWSVDYIIDANKLELLSENMLTKDAKKGMTRAEYADIITTLYSKFTKLPKTIENPEKENPFTDTNDVNIITAHKYKLFNGIGNNMANPDGILTREQMCTLINRTILQTGNVVSDYKMPKQYSSFRKEYKDQKDISEFALQSMINLNNDMIILGDSQGYLKPKANISRQEAVIVSLRSLKTYMPFGLEKSPQLYEKDVYNRVYKLAYAMLNVNTNDDGTNYSSDYYLGSTTAESKPLYYWYAIMDYVTKSADYKPLQDDQKTQYYLYKYDIKKIGFQMFGEENLIDIPKGHEEVIYEDSDKPTMMFLDTSKFNYYKNIKTKNIKFKPIRNLKREAVGFKMKLTKPDSKNAENYYIYVKTKKFDGKELLTIDKISKVPYNFAK